MTNLTLRAGRLTGLSNAEIDGNFTALRDGVDSKAPATHAHNAGEITSGTLAPARLGTGTPTAGAYVDGGTGAWTVLPAGVGGAATTDAGALTTGTLAVARLGSSGTRDGTTVLYGDNTWKPAPTGSGGAATTDAGALTTGTLAVGRLGTSGTRDASTVLYGDNTWKVAPTGGGAATTDASLLTSGTLAVAHLGSTGTRDATTYLAGDNTWKTTPATGASVGSTTPAMNGVAAAGSATTAARSDHVHPVDTSRLAASAVSTYGLTLVDDADAATARATLGLGTAATSAATAFATPADISAAKVEALPQFEVAASATLAVTRAAHQGATIILAGTGATISFSATAQGNGFVFSLKNRTGAAWTVPAFTGATVEYARAATHTTVVNGGDVSFEVYTRNSTMYVSVLGDTA